MDLKRNPYNLITEFEYFDLKKHFEINRNRNKKSFCALILGR